MGPKDRLTFDEACKELGITEDELEQLVANGEVASIKEGDTFFFKRDVLAQFKKNRKTEPTIILADEDMELLDVMDEIDLDTPKSAGKAPEKADAAKRPGAAPMAPEPQPAAAGDLLDFDAGDLAKAAEEVEITPRGAEPQPASTAPEDTVLNLDGLLEDDGSEGTTPIPGAEAAGKMVDDSADLTVEGTVSDETLLDTDLLEIGEEEDSFKLDAAGDDALTEPTEATLLRGGGARAMQMKRKKSHAGMSVLLVLTCAALLVPLFLTVNTLFVSRPNPSSEAPLSPKAMKEQPYEICLSLSGYAAPLVEWVADLTGG